MRRTMVFVAILLVALPLAACKPKGTSPGASNASASSSPLKEDFENALPAIGQIMVGTFRLEGTGQAVTAKQAGELVPAWKGYRSLSGSDTASAAELNALVEQIIDAMTPEQLKAIAALTLTREDMTTVMQEQGLDVPTGNFGDMTEEQIAALRATRQAGGGEGGGEPPGGGVPGGGVPGGGVPGGGGFGGGPGGGQAPDPERMAGLRAGGGGGAFLTRSPLYDKLIALLEAKS